MKKEVIDVTPTWKGLVPSFVLLIEEGKPSGRAYAIKEINRMATICDKVVEAQKKGKLKGVL